MANEKRLIDANALAKDLEVLAKYEDSFRQSVILGVVYTVKAQPTVDAVEVVHGRWIPQLVIEHDIKGVHSCHTEYRCSICNKVELKDSNYCPNCSAKMDLEEKK